MTLLAISLPNSIDVRLEKAPANSLGIQLCWPTEAGMFVTYLRESDGPAFDRVMNAILDGGALAEAMTVGYHVRSLWQKFMTSSPDRK